MNTSHIDKKVYEYTIYYYRSTFDYPLADYPLSFTGSSPYIYLYKKEKIYLSLHYTYTSLLF